MFPSLGMLDRKIKKTDAHTGNKMSLGKQEMQTLEPLKTAVPFSLKKTKKNHIILGFKCFS